MGSNSMICTPDETVAPVLTAAEVTLPVRCCETLQSIGPWLHCLSLALPFTGFLPYLLYRTAGDKLLIAAGKEWAREQARAALSSTAWRDFKIGILNARWQIYSGHCTYTLMQLRLHEMIHNSPNACNAFSRDAKLSYLFATYTCIPFYPPLLLA